MASHTPRQQPPRPTRPGVVPRLEVFAAGQHKGQSFTPQDLDRIVANFNRFSGENGRRIGVKINPPVVIGHDDEQQVLSDSGLLAAGVVSRLWREGPKLIATLSDVPPKVAFALRTGALRTCSVEIDPDFADQGRAYGLTLRRLALLGGDLPQVKSLDDLPRLYADMPATLLRVTTTRITRGPSRLLCFSEVLPMDRSQMDAALKAKMPWLTDETLGTLSDEQVGKLLADCMAADAPPAPDAKAPPEGQMADATHATGAGLPAAASAPPAPSALPGVPSNPSKVTLQYADREAQTLLASIKAKAAEADRLAGQRLERERDKKIQVFWDEFVRAGVKEPHEEQVTKLAMRKLDDGKALKFSDATEYMSELEYFRHKTLGARKVMAFSEQIPAGRPASGGYTPQMRNYLSRSTTGQAVLKKAAASN